eukprot:2579234-Rhodomonas_salina.2
MTCYRVGRRMEGRGGTCAWHCAHVRESVTARDAHAQSEKARERESERSSKKEREGERARSHARPREMPDLVCGEEKAGDGEVEGVDACGARQICRQRRLMQAQRREPVANLG